MRHLKSWWDLAFQHQGTAIVLMAILLVVFVSLTAMTVDGFHLFLTRNELHNAADAGALAGARFLYNDSGTSVNPGANAIAHTAATDNMSQNTVVEVNADFANNTGDVERGHWSFATQSFTPNPSLAPVALWGVSSAELDANPDFINAVRVKTRRESTPAASFFARIFGYNSFALSHEAVAYIGFAGILGPTEVDQPIAICKQSIIDSNGNYTCTTGRMIDSGGSTTHNSAAWTNFSQPCQTASVSTVRPLVCGSGNPGPIILGSGIGTTGGMQDNVYRDLRDCWLAQALPKDNRGYPIVAWTMSLPVIDCPSNNPGPCSEMVGTVTLDVLWIKDSGADPQWKDIPREMDDWRCSVWIAAGEPPNINDLTEAQRIQCWAEFATWFNLRTANNTPVSTLTHSEIQKTILFRPDCAPHEPLGQTGGQNFGILAKIPVLVK